MKGLLGILAAVLAATPVAGAAYAAEFPTRGEYVMAVEPICKRSTEANRRILRGVRGKIRRGRLPAAGRQFIRASNAFGRAVRRIIATPRPPADAQRLVSWFDFLLTVKANLRKVGGALREGNRMRANHEAIKVERSANAANNVASIFPFRDCRLTRSRFGGL